MTGMECSEPSAALEGRRKKNQTVRGRRYRRQKEREKSNRLLAIVQLPGYAPHRGYVDWRFEGRTLLHTGVYIKYPKNSSSQRWLKRVSSKKVRRYPQLPKKGNGYRKVFDYQWSLY